MKCMFTWAPRKSLRCRGHTGPIHLGWERSRASADGYLVRSNIALDVEKDLLSATSCVRASSTCVSGFWHSYQLSQVDSFYYQNGILNRNVAPSNLRLQICGNLQKTISNGGVQKDRFEKWAIFQSDVLGWRNTRAKMVNPTIQPLPSTSKTKNHIKELRIRPGDDILHFSEGYKPTCFSRQIKRVAKAPVVFSSPRSGRLVG